MADLPAHFCPGCGTPQRAFPRYPWHFCNGCLDRARDREGRRIVVGNTAAFGGFGWRYADEDAAAMRGCLGLIALIGGRPAYLHEARFGGVVAEPLASVAMPDRRGVWRVDGRFAVEPPER